jgi:hypothetical protein
VNNHNLSDIAHNLYLDNCIKDLLKQITHNACERSPVDRKLISDMLSPDKPIENEYEEIAEMHSNIPSINGDEMENKIFMESKKTSLKKKPSVKSSKSVENIYDKVKSIKRFNHENSIDKDLSKSCDELAEDKKGKKNMGEDDDEDETYLLENGNSVELVFISDEYLNKISKEQDQVIVVDNKNKDKLKNLLKQDKDDKNIVVITDDYKNKILKNNTIIVKNKRKSSKKMKKSESMKAKAYNTNSSSFLAYEEPESLEDKIFK